MQYFNVTFFPSSLTTFPRGNSKPKEQRRRQKQNCADPTKSKDHTHVQRPSNSNK
jgi:hypothetical protein